jgi:hypothetical protein
VIIDPVLEAIVVEAHIRLARARLGINETVRFIPALNVSQEELELGFDIFAQSMKETLKDYYVERDVEVTPPQQQVPFYLPLEEGSRKKMYSDGAMHM